MNSCGNCRPVFAASFILFILIAHTAFSQDKIDPQASFKKKVAQFEQFFSSAPKLLQKEIFVESPTGYIFYYQRFDDCKISYDMEKIGSAPDSYRGYIFVIYKEARSNLCGDFMSGYPSKRCYTTEKDARAHRDSEMCYDFFDFRSAKFIFEFQKKWEFRDVTWGAYDIPHIYFLNALGRASSDRLYPVKDNDFWKELIR